MISKINKLSMKEIIKRIGFPLSIDEFGFTYNLTENSVESEVEFENGLTTRSAILDIQNWICKHENLFDKEVYVLHIARLLEKDIEEAKRQNILGHNKNVKQNVYVDPNTNNKRRAFITARELLKDSDTIDIEVGSSLADIKLIFSQDYIGNTSRREKREAKSQEQLDKIEDILGLEEVLKHLEPDDLIDICKYPNLASVLKTELYKETTDSDEEYILEDSNFGNRYDFDRTEFEKAVKKYIHCMDLDKMLALSANNYLSRHVSDFSTLLSEDLEKIKEYAQKVESLVDKEKARFISKRFNGKKISIKQTLSAIDDYESSFINGVYYDYEAKSELIEDIIFGNVALDTIPKEDFSKKLNLTIEEKAILIRNNPDAFNYLVQNELLSESEIQELLTYKTNFSDSQFVLLMQKGIIKKDSILDLYNSGKITLENINAVKLGLDNEDITTIVSNERLVELYLDKTKAEEFEKYRKLYKLLVVDETRKEQNERKSIVGDAEKNADLDSRIENRRKDNGYAILEQSYELLDTERLFELYYWGLINVDVIVECSGNEGVSQLYASKELKPIDARRLYDSGALTAEMLENVFKSNDLTETEKLVLIYSTFSKDDEKDEELRTKFIKMLREPVDSERSHGSGEPKTKGEEKDKISSIVENRKVSDPFTRWHLISKLDKEYSQDYLDDGTIIFYLPNEGVYITEKLYAKGSVPAYGYATYVIDKDVFESERDNIVKSNTLNQTHLVNMKKNKVPGVTKLVHTGWANSMIRFFEIEESERYTEEEKENIKRIAERVEESKKPLNRDDVINL